MVPERKDLANSRGNGQPAVAYKSESGWQDVDQKDRRYFDRSSKSRWNWLVFLFTNFINFINRSFHVTNAESDRIRAAVQWNLPEGAEFEAGFRLVLNHFKPIKQVTWHGRGDYFATVMPEGANRSALIHQLSKRRTQIPFSKSKGLIQCVLFHPVKPCLFVAVSSIFAASLIFSC